MHLTKETWAALQARPDPALLEHLASGCDTCDAFLALQPGPEGAVDALLLRLAPRSAAPPDELAWARFKRERARTFRRWPLMAAAAAVLLVVATVVAARPSPTQPAPWTGLKGSGTSALELRAALQSTTGGLTPIDDGAAVPSSAALVFQVRSTVAGPARLFIQRGTNAPVELTQLGLVQGSQELERGDDGLLGFSLSGERGPVAIWLVAAEAPLGVDAALAAIRAGGAQDVAVAKLWVDVTP